MTSPLSGIGPRPVRADTVTPDDISALTGHPLLIEKGESAMPEGKNQRMRGHTETGEEIEVSGPPVPVTIRVTPLATGVGHQVDPSEDTDDNEQ